MGIVYVFTNNVNGKKYVGQTDNFNRRYNEHVSRAGGKKGHFYFQRALAKYGPENFGIERIICSDSDMDFYEDLIIDKLNTLAPNGYNLRKGGRTGKHSPESRQKMSEAHKGKYCGSRSHLYGKKYSPEHCAKISESQKGKKHSTETCAKISESQKGEKNHNSRSIELTHPDGTIETFTCIRDASRKYGLGHCELSKVALCKAKQHKGFTCKYIVLKNIE